MRADLLLDAAAAPGARLPLLYYPPGDDPTPLLHMAVSDEAPLRPAPLPPPAPLAANPIAAPDLARAERHALVFAGGARPGEHRPGQMQQDSAQTHGVWTVNGRPFDHGPSGSDHRRIPPLLTLKRGASIVFDLKNDTVFDHPMHLHGHTFRILSRNGKAQAAPQLSDTILMSQQESAEIAFVADNPGDWMLHCHILEHQEAGMGAVCRVTG
jgi:FtsP/CotA-like multicopper oxidase with cupredoxin domain